MPSCFSLERPRSRAASRLGPALTWPASRDELASVAERLGRPLRQWVRNKEAAYAEAGLSDESSDEALLDAVAQHPILMERPILVRGRRAALGRPPEDVLALLD